MVRVFLAILVAACLVSSCKTIKNFETPPGVIIAYSPTETKKYIGSPSIYKLSTGELIASHDYFGTGSAMDDIGEAKTRIYRSEDNGETWEYLLELTGQFHSNLFTFQDRLYILGTSHRFGDIVIRVSEDKGETWSTPSDLTSGVLRKGRFHTTSTPVIEANGRLWRAIEDVDGEINKWGKWFRSYMLSAPVGSNLLDGSNWKLSNPLSFDTNYLNGKFGGWLEGNAVLLKDGSVANVLRTEYLEKNQQMMAIQYTSKNGDSLSFNPTKNFTEFPGGYVKFTVRYDSISNRYWSLSNYVPEEVQKDYLDIDMSGQRNCQVLISSPDLYTWKIHKVVLFDPDIVKKGFQYVDWIIDGEDMLLVSRTAFEAEGIEPPNNHDSNYMTFHRIQHFRKYLNKMIN